MTIPKPLKIVLEQAEDESLWFAPVYASEDLLQRALRELHDAVEKYFAEEPEPK